jgi:hypothetical protein
MGMEYDKINNGPFSGFAPPQSIGIDLATPTLMIAGSNGQWVPATGGLVGEGATITAATAITVTNAVHHLAGTTAVQTINLPAGSPKGTRVTLIPDAASGQSTTTGGNIALGSTLVQNKALTLTWDGVNFFPSY